MRSQFGSSAQYDTTTGQDAAFKLGQEQSALQGQQFANLYGGNVADVLASTKRIRDIQEYLRRGGYDPSGEVIPRTRLSSVTESASHSLGD